MSVFGAMLGLDPGNTRLIVGIEDDEDGSLRVYLDRRWTNLHTHVADEEVKRQVRNSWGYQGHVFTDVPADALCDCPAPAQDGAR